MYKENNSTSTTKKHPCRIIILVKEELGQFKPIINLKNSKKILIDIVGGIVQIKLNWTKIAGISR